MTQLKSDHTPPLPDFDLDSFTPYRLAVAAKRTSEELSRQYRDRFGISIPEWRVLVHLVQEGEATSVRDIESRVQLEKYEVSRTAKRLVEKGLIDKTPHLSDRRLVKLVLTEEGYHMMAQLLPRAMAYQQEIERRLGAAFDGLETGLTELLRNTD